MVSQNLAVHTETSLNQISEPRIESAKPDLTEFKHMYKNSAIDIEGPCLIFSASPIELTEKLINKKIIFTIAVTEGVSSS